MLLSKSSYRLSNRSALEKLTLSPFCKAAVHTGECKCGFPCHRSIIQTELLSQWQSWVFIHQYFPHTFVKTRAIRMTAIITVTIPITYCTVKHISHNCIKRFFTIPFKISRFLQIPVCLISRTSFSRGIFCVFPQSLPVYTTFKENVNQTH